MRSQKELKEEYKQMKLPAGVFQIKNSINHKIFIGSSTDLKSTWNSQRFQLENGLHPNAALQNDWNEHGAANFTYEVLAEHKVSDDPAANVKQELKTLEQMFIEELQPFGDNGYNKQK